MGWPMTQNTSQKMQLPTRALSKLRSRYLVAHTSGACASIPKKACNEMWRNGTLMMTYVVERGKTRRGATRP